MDRYQALLEDMRQEYDAQITYIKENNMEVLQGKGEQKSQKHLTLFDAMNGHFSVLNRLSKLADRIEGEQPLEKDKSTVEPNPSLKEFLLNAPDQMGRMTDILATQIDKIEANLF